LDIHTARAAARKAVEAYGQRFQDYSFTARWVRDDRVELGFVVAGRRLEGAMEVLPSRLELELDVPFIFRPFRGTAISIIEREAVAWLDRAKAGELVA
jgi:hypothetical protein